MPRQFEVYRNPGDNQAMIPFIVVVQSNEFDGVATRVAVPLISAASFPSPGSDVGPSLIVDDQAVVLDPLQIATVPASVLRQPVASLRDDEDRITRALDAMLSTAWG